MTEEELSKWATKLIQRFDNTKIIGAGGEWSGDARQGFMFNPIPKGPAGTTPTVSGACCYPNGSCTVVTQSICEASGGTYQGDGTDCDPNPCGGGEPTGACCFDDGSCSITTEVTCEDGGGTYQGDDTTCEDADCFNCSAGTDLAFCAEWSVSCTDGSAEENCPCYFSSIAWEDNCCNTPPSFQCGNNDPAVTGTCNCTGYEPSASSSVQAITFVEDGECKVQIFLQVSPQCSRPGFVPCNGLSPSGNWIVSFDDHLFTLSDSFPLDAGSCTFNLTVTW